MSEIIEMNDWIDLHVNELFNSHFDLDNIIPLVDDKGFIVDLMIYSAKEFAWNDEDEYNPSDYPSLRLEDDGSFVHNVDGVFYDNSCLMSSEDFYKCKKIKNNYSKALGLFVSQIEDMVEDKDMYFGFLYPLIDSEGKCSDVVDAQDEPKSMIYEYQSYDADDLVALYSKEIDSLFGTVNAGNYLMLEDDYKLTKHSDDYDEFLDEPFEKEFDFYPLIDNQGIIRDVIKDPDGKECFSEVFNKIYYCYEFIKLHYDFNNTYYKANDEHKTNCIMLESDWDHM